MLGDAGTREDDKHPYNMTDKYRGGNLASDHRFPSGLPLQYGLGKTVLYY